MTMELLERMDDLSFEGYNHKEISNLTGLKYSMVHRYIRTIECLRTGQEVCRSFRKGVQFDLVCQYVKTKEHRSRLFPGIAAMPVPKARLTSGCVSEESDDLSGLIRTIESGDGNPHQDTGEILRSLLEQPEKIGIAVGFKDLLPIHGQWIHEMVFGTEDYTLQAHRAAFKSSCLAVALSLIMVLFPTENIIFVRKADNDVSEMLRMVSKVLSSRIFSSIVSMLYKGVILRIVESASDHLSTNLWTSPMGAPQLLGIGMKASITGKHATFVVTDDICNITDRLSRAERERTKMQYQELQNIRNRDGRIINLGTPWHKQDVFTLMPNIHRYDCYSTGLISPEKLDDIRRSMSPSLFAANYELKHIASGEAWFDTPPKARADPKRLRDGLAHIDAAYGGEDYTALTCASRIGNTIYIYGRLWKRHVSQVLSLILEETDRLKCAPIYCESNGDKGFLKKEIDARDHWGRDYVETQNKMLKISTHLRKWWPHIVFVEGTDPEYINQILDYTENAEHDDAPDSAACVCRILGRFGFDETDDEQE